MAKELAHFTNFAKLKDTRIAFNDITVLAGKPGTGKSYIMKFVYAVDEAICSLLNGNYKMHYALMDMDTNNAMIHTFVNSGILFDDPSLKSEKPTIKNFFSKNKYIELAERLKEIKDNPSKNIDSGFDLLYRHVNDLANKQKKYLNATEEEKFHFILRNILESIFGSMEQISSEFSFKYNQTQIEYRESKLNIEQLNISNEIESAIFVETPLILEFEKFLPKERYQTPYHIDSLLRELNTNEFSFTSDETSGFINDFRNVSSSIINGNISKENQGFSFQSENGRTYNIINASSGIKSIGLLQYLVTNKALKKSSVLYWEEPEVHLHPKWQLKMIELFIELMNAGVKIVFSTHSHFMADSLNALSKKGKFEERISFNLLQENNGIVENHILDSDEKWQMIQDELLGSLEDIMWQYL